MITSLNNNGGDVVVHQTDVFLAQPDAQAIGRRAPRHHDPLVVDSELRDGRIAVERGASCEFNRNTEARLESEAVQNLPREFLRRIQQMTIVRPDFSQRRATPRALA